MTLEEAVEYYFAKGQKDYVNDDFDPPLNMLTSIGADSYDLAKEKAYMAGWAHAKSQD
jgi:hypothetical protein